MQPERDDYYYNRIKNKNMPGGYLYGWDDTNEKWVKMICDANGKLKMDPALMLENPPTEDEDKKAATSEWSFDHAANENAHHSDDLIVPYPNFTWQGDDLPTSYDYGFSISYVNAVHDWPSYGVVMNFRGVSVIANYGAGQMFFPVGGDDYTDKILIRYADYDTEDWVAWREVAPDVDGKIATHAAIAAAHHAKYTDLEAQTACNLNGGLHWSCSGNAFTTGSPDTDEVTKWGTGKIVVNADDISLMVQVNIPEGCTISGVIVYGNEAAEAEIFRLRRYKPVDNTYVEMGSQNVNTEDITISYAIIDNGQYSYFLLVESMDTDDEIWGAVITYTL